MLTRRFGAVCKRLGTFAINSSLLSVPRKGGRHKAPITIRSTNTEERDDRHQYALESALPVLR